MSHQIILKVKHVNVKQEMYYAVLLYVTFFKVYKHYKYSHVSGFDDLYLHKSFMSQELSLIFKDHSFCIACNICMYLFMKQNFF